MENNEHKKNPLIQGDHSSIAVKELHNTEDNHTDSHDVISNTHNIVNQNSTVVYSGIAATEKLLSQRREEYLRFCQKNIVSKIISKNMRLSLNDKALQLQLDADCCEEIERSVIARLESGELTAADRITLEMSIEAIKHNEVKEMLGKLIALADKSDDDEVQFYSNLALAVCDPRRCIMRYESKTFDSYWQAFWTYLAYKRSGNTLKGEEILSRLSEWTEYPEDQVIILNGTGCLYDYFASNASESSKKTALGYLSRCTTYSSLLSSFLETLIYLTKQSRPLYFKNNSEMDFYLTLFGAKKPIHAANRTVSQAPIIESRSDSFVPDEIYKIAHEANVTKPISNTTYNNVSIKDPIKTNNFKWKYVLVPATLIVAAWIFFGRSSSPEQKSSITEIQTEETINHSSTSDNSNNIQDKQTTNRTTTKNKEKKITSTTPKQSYSTSSEQKTYQPKEDVVENSTPRQQQSSTIAPDPIPKASKLQELQQDAAAGNTQAMCKLGLVYLDGDGVKKSNKTAFSYFSQAAQAGNIEGMYWLGWCYRMGRGTTKNIDQAKAWWAKAAAAGHAEAAAGVDELKSLM